MSSHSIKNPQRKAIENENVLQTNTSNTEHAEDFNKNITKEKENEISQRTDVVINIDESLEEKNMKRENNDKNFMVYEYHEQKRVLPTTYVYFQNTAQQIPSAGTPLDYTSDRNGFVRLVFLIVFIMILVTATFTFMVFIIEPLKEFFLKMGIFLAIGAMALMIGLNYAMACSPCTRIMPCNIICLALAVCGMSVLCSYVTIRYNTHIVLLAVVATGGVVMVCLLLACTSFDFTKWLLYVVVIAAAFGLVALASSMYMLISGNYIKILHLVILCVGTIINVVILTIELQMILGGKAVELAEDDYALAAYLLYTSIIDIFLKLVQIMGILDSY